MSKRKCSNKRHKREVVWSRPNGDVCYWCGLQLIPIPPGCAVQLFNMFTLDHLIPIAEGGSDRLDNLVSACFDCNQERSKHTSRLMNLRQAA